MIIASQVECLEYHREKKFSTNARTTISVYVANILYLQNWKIFSFIEPDGRVCVLPAAPLSPIDFLATSAKAPMPKPTAKPVAEKQRQIFNANKSQCIDAFIRNADTLIPSSATEMHAATLQKYPQCQQF